MLKHLVVATPVYPITGLELMDIIALLSAYSETKVFGVVRLISSINVLKNWREYTPLIFLK